MVKYRPHRGSLSDAMSVSKEFDTVDQMLKYIVAEWNRGIDAFDISDLSITEDYGKDKRIDWKENRYVCTRRICEDKYDIPQCIGMCSIE